MLVDVRNTLTWTISARKGQRTPAMSSHSTFSVLSTIALSPLLAVACGGTADWSDLADEIVDQANNNMGGAAQGDTDDDSVEDGGMAGAGTDVEDGGMGGEGPDVEEGGTGGKTGGDDEPTCTPGEITLPIIDSLIGSYSSNIDGSYPTSAAFHATKWTKGGAPHAWRGLMRIDLPELPEGAVVESVSLDLFATTYRETYEVGGGHSNLTSSNAASFLPIQEAWDESTVTWNNQPSTSQEEALPLAQSTSAGQNYSLDLTTWAEDVYSGNVQNYGFMFQLDEEQHYASMYFDSSDVNPQEGQAPVATLVYDCVDR